MGNVINFSNTGCWYHKKLETFFEMIETVIESETIDFTEPRYNRFLLTEDRALEFFISTKCSGSLKYTSIESWMIDLLIGRVATVEGYSGSPHIPDLIHLLALVEADIDIRALDVFRQPDGGVILEFETEQERGIYYTLGIVNLTDLDKTYMKRGKF